MKERLDVTARLARWGQALVGIAQTGLAFCKNPFDVERYEELLRLAAEMMATVNTEACLEPDLAERLAAEWRRQVEPGFKGYAGPKVGVGAIVFNERDEILLVCSAVHGQWLFPAGMADVGYSPAEVVRKEVMEETGLKVTPIQLMGVEDSFRRGFNLHTHIYSLLFYCRLDGGELRPRTAEILEAGFFARDNLPRPLSGDGEYWVDEAFDWHAGLRREPLFD